MSIVVVVVVATAFLLGLLIGEQWRNRRLKRRERQLADARQQLRELTRAQRERQRSPDS